MNHMPTHEFEKWIDHWNLRIPQLLYSLEMLNESLSEQFFFDSNYQLIRNSIIKNYIKDILETFEGLIVIRESNINEVLGEIAKVISESIRALYPLRSYDFNRSIYLSPRRAVLAWERTKNERPKYSGRPIDPSSIPSIIQSEAGVLAMLEKCLTVYGIQKKVATNTQLAQALKNKFHIPGDITSITRQMTPDKHGAVISLVKDIAKNLRDVTTRSSNV